MKTVMKKLLSVMLVALLLVSAVPAAFADEVSTVDITIYEVIDGNANQVAVVEDVNVDAYASLEAMADAIYDGEFELIRYKDFGDGTAMLQLKPIATVEKEELFTLTLVHNNGTSDKTSFKVLKGTKILEAIAEYGVQLPAYEGHTFVGWAFSHTTNDAGDADHVVNRYHVIEGDLTLWADYDVISDDDEDKDDAAYDAVLKIYTNGKTSAAAKSVELDIYAVDGKITRDEIEACVKKYYKAANDNGMTFYGLYTSSADLANYKNTTGASTVELDVNKTTTIYVMVTNATAITTTTTKPADSTNPQTGDAIGIALAVMMCSGGAALTLGKKKF